MSPALLLLFLALPARAADVQALIAKTEAYVHAQNDKDAGVVRDLDRALDKLSGEASKMGWTAARPLGAAARDRARALKARLWFVAYLESLRDPASFPELKALLLDRAQPDLLREAAARALAAAPVGKRAKSGALCAALDADPGPQTLVSLLFELEPLGCDDITALEKRATAHGSKPAGRELARVAHALGAIAHSAHPAALQALDRLWERFARGGEPRRLILEALAKRAPELVLGGDKATARALDMLEQEGRAPANAAAALRLLAALGDARAADAAARYLHDGDGGVVVASAETLAALRARQWRSAVAEIYDRFPQDDRFAPGPGRDPLGWYDRLGAALKALQ